jgi:hypothetical protein
MESIPKYGKETEDTNINILVCPTFGKRCRFEAQLF